MYDFNISCDTIVGAIISLTSGVVGFTVQAIVSSIKDKKNKKYELLLKTYDQKIIAYRELNKWLVSVESKTYNPEKIVKGVDEKDCLNFTIFDDFNGLWNAYLDNEMFFNDKIKAIFVSISSSIVCINRNIERYNETHEDTYVSVIKDQIAHLYNDVMRSRSEIYKELKINEMEKDI